jgi:serine/threonine protein kinase
MPKPVSGSSATVFSLIGADGQRRTAVKCFTRHVIDQERRYQAISEHLDLIDTESLSQPWKIDFEYLPDGILVEGVRYPILKMDWVDGVHLSQWLSLHHQDQAAVTEIARKFAELVSDLDRNDIAHGDLQHGNLLVAQDRTLRLVDYDGLFVPALAGQLGNEIGHRNYQSPHRTLGNFGPTMDNFSAWVIYVSLIAVAADPALWPQLHDVDGEYLILSEDDFSDPASSPHFPGLLRHSIPAISTAMSQLRLLCEKPLEEIPKLDLSRFCTAVEVARNDLANDTSEIITKTQSGRPSWLDGHLSTNTIRQDFSVESFQGRHRREILLALLGLLAVTAPLIAVATESVDSDVIILGAFFMSSLFFALAANSRAKRGELDALRNKQKSLDQLLALTKEASANYATAHNERALIIEDEEERTEKNIDQNQELTHQLHQTQARIESARHSAAETLEQELRSLRAEKESAFSERLLPLQEPWVRERLPSFLLSDAHLPGITSKNISSLAALGFRTAEDISGVKRIRGGSDALLITGDGIPLKVAGIGPSKADALYAWRQQCEEEARASCPVRLPADEEAEIDRNFESRFKSIATRKSAVDQEAEHKRSAAKQELAALRTRLADIHQEELEDLRERRRELDGQIASIRASSTDLHHLSQSRDMLTAGARKLSYWSYLRFLYIGNRQGEQ